MLRLATGRTRLLCSVAPMMREQARLPSLPLPQLEDTMNLYIEFLEPLVSEEQLAHTKSLARDFLENDGTVLQGDLLKLREEAESRGASWLSGFWQSMYLRLRESQMIHTSPFLVLADDPTRTSQAQRAANLAYGCAIHLLNIRSGQLEPDYERDQPYDMTQHTQLFGSTRFPRMEYDDITVNTSSRHIIVMCRDQFFPLDILTEDGQLVPEQKLAGSLAHILSTAKESPPLGVLTSEERDTWARVRAEMELSAVNRSSLKVVDDAQFVLCLDDASPHTDEGVSKHFLHADARNRWFDKLMLVVCANGRAGNVMEHTLVDGHTGLRLWHEVYHHAVAKKAIKPAKTKIEKPDALKWKVRAGVATGLTSARLRAEASINETDIAAMRFTNFGATFIKSAKCSPDAFLQMAFQLAHYRVRGKLESTYESANTKTFRTGRTETVRSTSSEAKRFVEVWSSTTASTGEKKQALLTAAAKHVQRMKDAKNGRAVDRHLYVLLNLARHRRDRLLDYEIPPFFVDPSFSTLLTSTLSTSQISAPMVDFCGFGPVTSGGFGISYGVRPDNLVFTVSSFKGESKAWMHALENSLLDMKMTMAAE